MSALRIVAQYDRPRYAIQKMNYSTAEGKVAGESEWETVLTEQEEFKAKLKAEAYTKKHDVRTRVIAREGDIA